jgi:hypothetical protein
MVKAVIAVGNAAAVTASIPGGRGTVFASGTTARSATAP